MAAVRSESEYLCFDITSVSSYSALNQHVKYGEDLPQINLALLFGQKSMLPVYYRQLPGNISDVRTLKNLLDTFAKLGMPKVHLVMDRGFYSKKNVDDLLAGRHKFEIGVPPCAANGFRTWWTNNGTTCSCLRT